MTQQVNTKYTRLLAKHQIFPVYLLQFEGVPIRFTTDNIKNPLGEYRPYLSNLQGAGAQITVDEGRASLGQVTFSILDKNQEFTQLAFLYQMANRIVSIYGGFKGLQEDEFVLVFTGRILDYTLQSNNTVWDLQATDLTNFETQNIFTGITQIAADCTNADVTLTVEGTGKFPTATAGVCYLRIDDEIISYTGVTDTTFTGCTRGLLGSVAAAHTSGTDCANLIYLAGNPLTLALQILLSTGAGTNGPYDVLPACAGLAIDQQYVNVAKFENQRDTWIGAWNFTFEESASVVGRTFLSEQIFTFVNTYPVVDAEGRISCKVYSPPLPNQIAQPLTDSIMLGPPTFQGNILARYFFNEIDISYDWDFIQGIFVSRELREDATSQALFGQTKTRTFQSRGIRVGALPGQFTINQLDSFITRFLKRFSIPSPILKAGAFYSTRLLEAGDIVPVTTAFTPNLATGKLGMNNVLMEIIQIDPDFLGANQSYTLLNTGYSYGKKYAAISPPSGAPISFPNYPDATIAQRNYAFICRELSPTSGVMGDGTPAYYITP